MTEKLTVVRRRVDLPGGRVLTVARYRGEDGSTAFVLHRGWIEETRPVLREGDGVLSLPGEVLPELLEALESLNEEADR